MRRQLLSIVVALFAIGCVDSALGDGNDVAGNKFAQCCQKEQIDCPEVCTYPPPDFSIAQQWCMAKGACSPFIKCYAGGHNNTECCEQHGVVGIYGICRDFCDGTASHGWDVRYLVCGPVKNIISKCNHDSVQQEARE